MKTVYTVPKISSLKDNGIKDLLYVASYLPELRLVYLTGVPVRIELNKEGYVELNSEEEEIDLSAYNDIFKSLSEFFYGTTYLYGFVNEGKFVVYDAFTNDNFLSSRDLMFLESKYKIPVVKPIAEGNFTVDYLVEVLNKKINNEGMKSNKFYILPSVYVDDTRTYTTATEVVKSKIILGEKKTTTTYTTWSGSNNVNSAIPAKNTTDTSLVKEAKKATETPKTDKVFTEIFMLSTKEERQTVFNQTLKNINNYISTLKISEDEKKWWDANGRFLTYLYSILTLPSTRGIVYDYGEIYQLNYIECSKPIEYKWSLLFIDLFMDEFSAAIASKKMKLTADFYEMFSLFFKEELIEFDKFFVKETEKSKDWRYCENLDYYGGW